MKKQTKPIPWWITKAAEDPDLSLIILEVLKLKDDKPNYYDVRFGNTIYTFDDFCTLLRSKEIKLRGANKEKRLAEMFDIVNYVRLALRDKIEEKK